MLFRGSLGNIQDVLEKFRRPNLPNRKWNIVVEYFEKVCVLIAVKKSVSDHICLLQRQSPTAAKMFSSHAANSSGVEIVACLYCH